MAKSSATVVSLRVPDDELAEIDAEAGENRTQFMLDAVRATIVRLKRERLDAEVGRLLAESADENLAIANEFEQTLSDGIG
jgi:hypothetical protein